jgi:hypothetical protein
MGWPHQNFSYTTAVKEETSNEEILDSIGCKLQEILSRTFVSICIYKCMSIIRLEIDVEMRVVLQPEHFKLYTLI